MTYVIAEVGSNWRTFSDVHLSIRLAKEVGADAVKFQWFSEADLYGFGSGTKNMDPAMIEDISDMCRKYEIDFMCTVFNPDDVAFIDEHVKYHKIASSEFKYMDLVQMIMASDKKVFMSVGGHTMKEIKDMVEDFIDEKKTTLMYCCNAYPSTAHDLRWIDELRRKLPCPVGFSDHSIDTYLPVSACHEHGAVAIEKHVRLKEISGTPDAPHSITFDQFAGMVDCIRRHDKRFPLVGDEQADAVKRHNRRLVATTRINQGDAVQYGRNVGLYRASKDVEGCLDYKFIPELEKARATLPCEVGDVITKGHLSW